MQAARFQQLRKGVSLARRPHPPPLRGALPCDRLAVAVLLLCEAGLERMHLSFVSGKSRPGTGRFLCSASRGGTFLPGLLDNAVVPWVPNGENLFPGLGSCAERPFLFIFWSDWRGSALQCYNTAILKDLQSLEPSTTAVPSSTGRLAHTLLWGSMHACSVHFNPFLPVLGASICLCLWTLYNGFLFRKHKPRGVHRAEGFLQQVLCLGFLILGPPGS